MGFSRPIIDNKTYKPIPFSAISNMSRKFQFRLGIFYRTYADLTHPLHTQVFPKHIFQFFLLTMNTKYIERII
jgi:hypothetical protein